MTDFPHPVEVTVYGRPGCQQCRQTTRELTKRGVPHTYRDVDADSTAATLAETYAAQSAGPKSLPLVVAGDLWWFGFRYEKLRRLADIHAAAADVAGLDRAAEQFLSGEVL